MANHSHSHSHSSRSSFFPEPAMEPAWLWSLVSSPGSTGGGSSPASSPDSCGGGGGGGFWPPEEGPHDLPWRSPGLAGAAGRGKAGGGGGAPRARLAHGQRQTASQREKLRMRHLAQALHALRRYLPGSGGGQVGQNLTKIETLRLAIRYIAHLSELLGLSEEELARRRGAAARARPGCPLCPPGLGCCQASPSPPVPFAQPRGGAAAAPTPAAAAAASPPAAPWGLSRSAPAATSCAAASGNPGLEEPPRWATFGPGAELLQGPAAEWPPPAGDLLPGHPQSLPDELLSFLEGFVPLALQDFLSPAHPLPAVLPPGPEARKECP